MSYIYCGCGGIRTMSDQINVSKRMNKMSILMEEKE